MNPKLVERHLKDFEQRCDRYGTEALRLASYAALPVALNPELLHLLRINFFAEKLPYRVEFDLLSSGICREIGSDLYEIEPDIRNELLRRWAKEPEAQKKIIEVATLLWQYVECYSPWQEKKALERSQQLTALNFLNPKAAQRWLEDAEKTKISEETEERQWLIAMRKEIDRLRIRSHFQQTPMLQGEGDRVVFGSDRLQPVYAVNVIKVDRERVLLDTGKAQGMRSGAEFALYPPKAIDFTQVSQRLALVRVADVEDVGAVRSWATIIKTFQNRPIEIGAQAVLLDPGSMRLRSNICLVRDRQTESASNEDDALESVREALEQDGKGFVVSIEGKPIDYQVAVNAEGAYEIRDAVGSAIELRPQILVNSDNAAIQVVRRLVHLTKYHNIQRLENNDSLSDLKGKLKVELLKARSDYEPGDKPEPQPFENPSEPAIRVGEWMFIHVKNDFLEPLNFAILGLQSDWGIKHFYPNSNMNFWRFDPGQEYYIPIRPKLPEGCAEDTDILKVFATIGPTQFRWLAMPPLDEPPEPKDVEFRQQRVPETSLEEFLAAMMADNLEAEELDPRTFDVYSASLEWVTEQRLIRIKRQV